MNLEQHGIAFHEAMNGHPRSASSARERRRNANNKPMSKPSKRSRVKRDDLRGEYQFHYRTSRTNRFASRMEEHAVAVVLEPDVARVFDSSKSVNRFLRSVIEAVPAGRPRLRRRKAG